MFCCCAGYGVTSDGRTRFINASTCSLNYKTTNRPIVFDVRLPAGVTKSDGVVTLIAARDAASPPSVALTSETHLEVRTLRGLVLHFCFL